MNKATLVDAAGRLRGQLAAESLDGGDMAEGTSRGRLRVHDQVGDTFTLVGLGSGGTPVFTRPMRQGGA